MSKTLTKSKLTVETLEHRLLLSVWTDYLRITEIMYDPAGSYSLQYIELQNISDSETLQLQGVKFTKGINYTFPSYSLGPKEFALIVESPGPGGAFEAHYGTGLPVVNTSKWGLELATEGERLQLKAPNGDEILDFRYNYNEDEVLDVWYPVTDDVGFSLTIVDTAADTDEWGDRKGWRPNSGYIDPDNPGHIDMRDGTPGKPDPDVDIAGVFERMVVINELMSHSHLTAPDWIELYNPNDYEVPIGNWYLSDSCSKPDFDDPNPDNWKYGYTKYVIPDGTVLGPHTYLVFHENTDFGIDPVNNPRDFALSESGEAVHLYSADAGGNLTGYFEERIFGASETNVSFGRYEKSTGTYNFVAMEEPTPLEPNSDPKVGTLVISEIMYNPAAYSQEEKNQGWDDDDEFEYVELTNITGVPIALKEYDTIQEVWTPWKFTRGIQYEFPGDTIIPAFGTLIVARNPDAFAFRYGTMPPGVQVLGPFQPQDPTKLPSATNPITALKNGGERVEISKPGELTDTDGRVYIRIDRVNYSDGSHPVGGDPWPTEPDGDNGDGSSLTRIQNDKYGNDPINWRGGDPLNQPPKITMFVDTPDPVTFGEELTLAVTVSDPGDVVTRVEFYHDTNGNNAFDSDEDTLLVVDANGADGWSWTGATGSFSIGMNRYFVRAQDDDEIWSTMAVSVGKINLAPTIDSLTDVPDPVSQSSTLTLTAGNVADADGTVVSVEFYRDTNGNGQLDADSNEWFGTDSSGVDGWSWSGTLSNYSIPLGAITYFARAQDNVGAWSDAVQATGTIIPPNDPPTIGSLSVAPDPVLLGNDITLTARNVNDPDGDVEFVIFLRDANGNGIFDFNLLDSFLGFGENGANVWTWTGSTAGFPSNMNTYFALAIDDANDWSDVVSTTGEIQSPNVSPTIDSLSDSPDPVIEGDNLTLTAIAVNDTDGDIVQVEFYHDTNDSGFLDVGVDALLGTVTQNSPDWSWTGSTAGFEVREYLYFARALDDDDEWSNTVSITGQVDPANEAPTVTSLSDSPDPVTRGADLTLTASGVADADGDETITKVEFYLDDGDGVFEAGEDTLLVEDDDGANGWSWTGPTVSLALGESTYFARVQDDFDAWSDAVDTTNTIEQFSVPGGQASSKTVKYTDMDGSEVSVKFKNVEALLYFEGVGLTTEVNGTTTTIVGATELTLVKMTQTPAGASLTFTVKNGNGLSTLGGITGANLDKLTGKNTSLQGDIDLTGYLGSVTLDDIAGSVTVTAQQSSPKGFSLKADVVNAGATFDLKDDVKKFQVNRFEDGLLQANGVNKVKIKEGIFGADVIARNGDILNVSAPGDITGFLNASNMIKKIATKAGDFTGVARAGNIIGTIQALNLDGAIISAGNTVQKVNIKNDITKSYILGGYDIGSDGLFGAGDILGSGSVQSVTAKGTFAQSYIAAGVLPSAPLTDFLPDVGVPEDFGEIGKVKFGIVDLTSPDDFGLYAATDINSVKVSNGPTETTPPFFVEDMNG